MREKTTQPVGGWTTWCLSARAIPRDDRMPAPRDSQKTQTQDTHHAG